MARISSGTNSKQDYQTPKALIDACTKRFGPLTFDLAAHAGNHVCEKYFAPCTTADGPMPVDQNAYGMDAFDYDWAELTKKFGGPLWLNPPFGEIPKWTQKYKEEAARGANGLLLIPYGTTGAFCDNVLGVADQYALVGRLAFIPKKSFPKDCCIYHYYPGSGGRVSFWDWKNNKILRKFMDY